MLVLPEERVYTMEYICNLPQEQRAKLIDKAGMREYWIADPVRRNISMWHLYINSPDFGTN